MLSTGEARGANLLLRVYWICVTDEAIAGCASIYFELCCLIVDETFFLVHPAERFCAEWGGEGDVDQGVFARTYLEDTTRALLSWNSCLRGLSGW